MRAVACTSSTECTAVGEGLGTNTTDWVPLAERWNGTTWSVQEPLGGGARSSGVSCASATECTFVGGYDSYTPLAENWNGTAWTEQELPLPSEAKYEILSGVSCTSTPTCMAVGYSENSSKEVVPVAEEGD